MSKIEYDRQFINDINELQRRMRREMTNTMASVKSKFKRKLMGEFSILYTNTNPNNMSSIEQVSEDLVKVSIRQYPEQGVTNDITLFDELHRLRYFGWQIRFIKYEKDSTLNIFFEKVDWRSVDYYGLKRTQYNNEKDLWWLKS